MRSQINRTRTCIKYSTSLKLGHIALITLEIHALVDCCQVESQVRDRCPLGYLLMGSLGHSFVTIQPGRNLSHVVRKSIFVICEH